jgi:hypothetical protein
MTQLKLRNSRLSNPHIRNKPKLSREELLLHPEIEKELILGITGRRDEKPSIANPVNNIL